MVIPCFTRYRVVSLDVSGEGRFRMAMVTAGRPEISFSLPTSMARIGQAWTQTGSPTA